MMTSKTAIRTPRLILSLQRLRLLSPVLHPSTARDAGVERTHKADCRGSDGGHTCDPAGCTGPALERRP